MRWTWCLAWVLASFAATAQTRYVTAGDATDLPKQWRGVSKVNGQAGVDQWWQGLRNHLVAKGWLEAACDTVRQHGDTSVCVMHTGKRYAWARLGKGNVPTEIASAASFREKLYTGRAITPRQVARLYEGLLAECEQNGFPFAVIGLDSIEQREDGLNAAMDLDRGPLTHIDSLVVRGTAKISARYLQAHTGIHPGDLYDERLIVALDKRMRELPFVTQRQAPYVLFAPGMTRVYLFLDAKRASSFNGILGIQPDPVTGNVKLTGDLDLRLRNSLRRGEAIDLNWRALADQTQDLKLRFNYPFAFNTPFGTDLSLKLFKRDTTFIEVTLRGALEYLLGRGDKISGFVSQRTSERLGRDFSATAGLGDVKITSYGLGAEHERFDYRFNPREGLAAALDASVGNKRSTTATLADQATTGYTYTTQYEVNGRAVWHIPLGRKGTLRIAGQGGSMVNPKLYRNELYRIGGIKTMRGVDEASIYCSSYAIGTLEYRFLFEENSNLLLFVDKGWWEDQSEGEFRTDAPIAFGVGTSFETKAGIFSLTYALGRQFNNPFEFNGGKLHFGFTSLF